MSTLATLECWGLWNEPNLGAFFQGTMGQYVNTIYYHFQYDPAPAGE